MESTSDLVYEGKLIHETSYSRRSERFQEIEIDGISKDFIKIGYKDNGNLYIATNQLDIIQKYIGAEGKKPRINKLGTTEWKSTIQS